MYDINSCTFTFLSSGHPLILHTLIVRSFKGKEVSLGKVEVKCVLHIATTEFAKTPSSFKSSEELA